MKQKQQTNKTKQNKRITPINDSNNFILYILRLTFAILRPVRIKYKLSINCLVVLNSCYLYSILINKEFSRYGICQFTSYYDPIRIKKYITVLVNRGFIEVIKISKDNRSIIYSITLAGVNCINEIDESYQQVIYEFCNKYNIVL